MSPARLNTVCVGARPLDIVFKYCLIDSSIDCCCVLKGLPTHGNTPITFG